jgi:hypothetical protein
VHATATMFGIREKILCAIIDGRTTSVVLKQFREQVVRFTAFILIVVFRESVEIDFTILNYSF